MATKTKSGAASVTKATKEQVDLAKEFITLLMSVEVQTKNLVTRGPSAVGAAKGDKEKDPSKAIAKDLAKEIKKLAALAKGASKSLDEIAAQLGPLRKGTIGVQGFQEAVAAPYKKFDAVATQVNAMEKKGLWANSGRLVPCEAMHIYAKDFTAAYTPASIAWAKVT